MNKLQEKLNFLLDKYSVSEKAVLKNDKTVVINGQEIPLFAHRSERRFIELRNIVNNGTLKGISVMRVARIIEKDADINEVIYRELDLCQWILGSEIEKITAVKNDNTLNMIARTKSGIVCTIEISATLKNGAKAVDKHEIIAERGTACDVVVDAQLKQDSIYVLGSEDKKYTDVDFELYGLEIEEIAVVRSAFAIAQNKNYDEMQNAHKSVIKLVEMTVKSVKENERR